MNLLMRVMAFSVALAPFAFSAVPSAYGSPQSGTKESTAAPEPPAVRTLRLSDTTVIPSSVPDAYSPQLKCDSSGDIFIRFAGHDATAGFDSAITEILPGSQQMKKYGSSPLSTSDFPNARLESFDIRPNGTVFALVYTRHDKPADGGPQPRPEYYVERFNDDGTTDSIPHLEPPPGIARWSPILLGVFSDGNFLITGYKVEVADPPNPGARKPLTAIYDSRGRFIHDVVLPDDVSSENPATAGAAYQNGDTRPSPKTANAQPPGSVKDGASASPAVPQAAPVRLAKNEPSFGSSITSGEVINGPDGNVWILRKSAPLRLYAVSSAGEVMKHFQFPTLVEGLKPVSFGFSGPEELFFQFELGSEIRPAGPLSFLAIFNAETGHFESRYVPPEPEKGYLFRFPACSDRHAGFLYFGTSPDNFLAVFDLKP